jgi:hypothetical protein
LPLLLLPHPAAQQTPIKVMATAARKVFIAISYMCDEVKDV